MADTYGVAPADVAGAMPALFGPGTAGFTQATVPTEVQVREWVATADAIATLAVRAAAGAAPSPTDTAAALARHYIVQWTKARVLDALYTGRAPEDVARAIKPYDDAAAAALADLRALAAQAAGDGLATDPSRFRGEAAVRTLVVDSCDLTMDDTTRGRW